VEQTHTLEMDPSDLPLAGLALAPHPTDPRSEMDPGDMLLLRGIIAKLAFASPYSRADPREPRAGESAEAWVTRVYAMRPEDREAVFKAAHAVFTAEYAPTFLHQYTVERGLSGWAPKPREDYSVWRLRLCLSKGDEFVALAALRVAILCNVWSNPVARRDVCWA